MGRKRGFTLLEVMVAAVIIAVGFAAIWRAAGLATDALELTRSKTFAMWAAKNIMAEYRLKNAWPDMGEEKGEVSAGKENLFMLKTVSGTPSVNFRKIKIEIFRREDDGYALARLTGYLVNEKAQFDKQE